MTNYEIYVFFLCLIVFTLLTTLFSAMLYYIVSQQLRLIRCGEEDKNLLKEFTKEKKQNKLIKVCNTVISLVLCGVLLFCFAFSIHINISEDVYFEGSPTLKVVQSGSMAVKNKANTYLFENGLDDQIATFDLILTYKIPKEDELKLYDIVVYEVDGTLIVHRIVGIEEPNQRHPDERWFTCQGDNVEIADRFPVHYYQMKGIYRGERVPFVGSFILFMQSPAGWLCILLILAAMVITPLLEKKLLKEKKQRFELIISKADSSKEEAKA